MQPLLRCAAVLLLALGWLGQAAAQQGTRRESVQFAPLGRSDIALTQGVLLLPEGAGPFPAVIVLHGCGGVRANSWRWAQDLVAQGVAALVADHFTPRRIDRICERDRGQMVEQRERRADTYGALAWLARRPDIRADRIAVLGMSNGGMTVLNALVPGLADPAQPRLRAGISFYPDCTGFRGLPISAPLLILVGEEDDWTPAAQCRRLVESLPAGSASVRLITYPHAHHAFDDESQITMYLPAVVNPHQRRGYGATVGYLGGAHAASRGDVKAFVLQHLLDTP